MLKIISNVDEFINYIVFFYNKNVSDLRYSNELIKYYEKGSFNDFLIVINSNSKFRLLIQSFFDELNIDYNKSILCMKNYQEPENINAIPKSIITKKHSVTNDMENILKNQKFATLINNIFELSKHDILVRKSTVPEMYKKGGGDLSHHSTFLEVVETNGFTNLLSFKRIEMVEAGTFNNLIGYNPDYNMGLSLGNYNTIYDKNNDWLKGAEVYKIHLASTGRKLMDTQKNTYRLLTKSIIEEGKYLKHNPRIYGGVYGEQYNCNTFICNILKRMVGEN